MISYKAINRYSNSNKENIFTQEPIVNSPKPLIKNQMKLNLKNLFRSTSEGKLKGSPILTPQTKQQNEQQNQTKNIVLTERNIEDDKQLKELHSNIKELLRNSLSVRSSKSNNLFHQQPFDFNFSHLESPKMSQQNVSQKMKIKHFLFDKKHLVNDQISKQLEEMKTNYINTSVALNKQLKENSKLIQFVEELKNQQTNLEIKKETSKSNSIKNYQENNNPQDKQIKSCLKFKIKQREENQQLIKIIENQKQTIQQLKKELEKERKQKHQILSLYNIIRQQADQQQKLLINSIDPNLIQKQ